MVDSLSEGHLKAAFSKQWRNSSGGERLFVHYRTPNTGQGFLEFPAFGAVQLGEGGEVEVDRVKLTETLDAQVSDSVAKRRFLSEFSMNICCLITSFAVEFITTSQPPHLSCDPHSSDYSITKRCHTGTCCPSWALPTPSILVPDSS